MANGELMKGHKGKDLFAQIGITLKAHLSSEIPIGLAKVLDATVLQVRSASPFAQSIIITY